MIEETNREEGEEAAAAEAVGNKRASAELLARAVLQRCLDLGSRDNMTIVLADLRQRQPRQRRKVRPRQPSPSPPEAPSSSTSSGLTSGGVGGGEGGVNDNLEQVAGGRGATTTTTAATEPAAGVEGVIPVGRLNQNGAEKGGGESDRSCLVGAGEEGGTAAASASRSADTSKEEPAGVPAPAPAPAVGPPMPAKVVDTEAEAGTAGGEVTVDPGIGGADVEVDVAGVGDSQATSSGGALKPAAVGGGSSVGEALSNGERSGLLRLPIDGDEGVVEAAA